MAMQNEDCFMDLKELKYLVTVANEGSISRAAEKLFMAQSSLSQAIRISEQDLGTPIFVRTARGVRPTAAGEAFIAHARQILQQYRAACSEAADIEGLKSGTILLGVSTYRGTYLLPPVLKRFRSLYPGIHVQISEMDSIDLEDQLLEGLLDLALIAAPPVRIQHDTDFLMRDEIMLATTADHPVMAFAHICKEEPQQLWIDLKDTAPFEYILGPPNTVLGRVARQALRDAAVEPLGSDTSLSASFAAAMAREGMGLAFTYRSCRVVRDPFRYLRVNQTGCYLDLALAWPIGKYRSLAALALADLFSRMVPELLQR